MDWDWVGVTFLVVGDRQLPQSSYRTDSVARIFFTSCGSDFLPRSRATFSDWTS